ncbi:unnamed protein product [Cuscuta campestris]|uniref:DUF4228 domain-containing protein n=1 Tax=Cuscuta campestris TaxID=132261 RepID=A0A484K2E1_9ASTE|nr:unnamed protein product [Cuscuta campestris]
MGNCVFGGAAGGDAGNGDVVRVMTSTNGVMEFYAPVTVESIADEFPGHGIFRRHDLFWNPLPHHEVLAPRNSYYLLPLDKTHVGPHPKQEELSVASYRMSFGRRRGILLKNSNSGGASSISGGKGRREGGLGCSLFWKVKLVISRKQLLEILSQESATEELIESVRTVAKCGKGGGGPGVSSSVAAFSDQWSLSSSRNASSKKDYCSSLQAKT